MSNHHFTMTRNKLTRLFELGAINTGDLKLMFVIM